MDSPVAPEPENTIDNNTSQDEVTAAKRGHVLTELLETERIYVTELGSILKGYKMEAFSDEMQPLVPIGFTEKLDIIFGNLEEICAFHANIFLKDLENCISSVDLVALCFVQRVLTLTFNISYFFFNTVVIYSEMLSINFIVTTAKIYQDQSIYVKVWWMPAHFFRHVKKN